jgi:hypothetical protein
VRFARFVFYIAGAYGLLVLAPMYFVYDLVGRQSPPPVTHPEFYYGFVGLGLVWQIAFLVIATDPARYRPMMIVSALEKASYVIAIVVLYLQQRAGLRILTSSMGDAILGLLFLASFFATRRSAAKLQRAVKP